MTDIVAAGVSLAGLPLQRAIARAADVRRRRRASADPLVRTLRRLTALCARREARAHKWAQRIRDLYAVIDEAEFTMPRHWAHLRRSLRAALGEATSLSFVDRYPDEAENFLAINDTWLRFAEDYLSYVLTRVGYWRESHSNLKAQRVRIDTFDDWLRRTRRYEIYRGIWPDDQRR